MLDMNFEWINDTEIPNCLFFPFGNRKLMHNIWLINYEVQVRCGWDRPFDMWTVTYKQFVIGIFDYLPINRYSFIHSFFLFYVRYACLTELQNEGKMCVYIANQLFNALITYMLHYPFIILQVW